MATIDPVTSNPNTSSGGPHIPLGEDEGALGWASPDHQYETTVVDLLSQEEVLSMVEPVDKPAEDEWPSTKPSLRWSRGVDWPVAVWIGLIHLLALGTPFFFTWKGLLLAAFFSYLTGGIGVCLGFHRHLTHGSFTTYRPVRWMLALIGGLSGEGSAISWVANHRKHHAFSDLPGDPHSPNDGGLWSHMLWFMPRFGQKYLDETAAKYAPDLVKDPMMRFLHAAFLPWHIATGGIMYAVGYFGWDAFTAMSFLTWGMGIRLLYVLHVTWFVNSASHMWGYRNYETTDNSRNLWWVGLLAFGEGWHNNHHAFQRMARHGHHWWEVDVTYWCILLMERLGLAWNVVHDVPARQRLLNSQKNPQPEGSAAK